MERENCALTPGARWHVLRGKPARRIDLDACLADFSRDGGPELEGFNPTFVSVVRRGAKSVRTERPLLCNYMFVRGTTDQIRDFCESTNWAVRMARSHAGGEDALPEPMTVSDADFEAFRHIAKVYRYDVPCFSLDEVDLSRGDRVQVVGGIFDGVTGILESRKGRTGGRVVLRVAENIGVATYDIEPQYIRVLEFAAGSKHIYDVIDAFVPRLERAAAERAADGELSMSATAALTYFVGRYGHARIGSAKIAAKYHAVLAAAHALLGSEEQAAAEAARVAGLMPAVTNARTTALINKLLTVTCQ